MIKKKFVGFALVVVMVLSFSVVAYAGGGGIDVEPVNVRLCIDTELE